ncbi:hypothetical protein BGZ74_005384 [Mortierella antarctica]|nr:hypothetical protein BGZ74_005384 [Mortierella antarctica]
MTSSDAQLCQAKDNVHNLIYFPFHGLAGCIRTTLIVSGEPYKFTNMMLKEWATAKELTPFGHVPLLREETKCGKTLELAEINAIEQFLAKRAGLLGKNEWEECNVKMYLNSTHSMISFLLHSIVPMPREDRPAFLAKFKATNLPQWVKHHEKHLAANGSNGHYVGDQLTIADIKTASVIEHVVRLCEDAPQVSEELTPAIWAVKTNLEKNPKYQEWRASEQYQQYTATNIGFIGF